MSLKKSIDGAFKSVPASLKNRYYIALALFFGWMILFDRGNILTQVKLANAVKELEQERTMFEEKIEEARIEKQELTADKERFGREKYFMQRANEDVFIVREE